MVGAIRPHYVKGNRASARPSDHLFFDIESELIESTPTVTEHRFKMGWSAYWRRCPIEKRDTVRYEFLTTAIDLIDIIDERARPKNPLLVIAHNVCYDAGVMDLFTLLYDAGWTMTAFYANGMTVIITFVQGNRKLKIMDNGNYFKSSLAALGKAIELPKLDIDFDASPWQEMKAYCKRDVEIMLEAWRQYYAFLDLHNFGNWGHTIPSQAWNAWRHRFMPFPVMIHGQAEAYEIERAGYHGGRTSVFYQGHKSGEQFYYVDVNSMYPAMMLDNLFPTRLVAVKPMRTLEGLMRDMSRFAVMAEVEVETDEPIFPTKHKGRNVYPVGRFWTTLTTPEIEYAIDNAMLRDVRRVATYERAKIFQDYVSYLYPLKLQYKREGNLPYYLMVKLFQNGLYGRFGMKGHKWTKLDQEVREFDEIIQYTDTTTGKKTKVYRYGSECWTCEETGETENSFPAVAAHVTALARLYLFSLCKQAGLGHYLYCDTDSLIVDATGYANLADKLDDDALGMLKVEEQADSIEILAPKFYRFGETWKRKGVSKNALQVDKRTFQTEVFPSFRTQGTWNPGQVFTTSKVTKHFSLAITDGTRQADGWIDPLRVEDIDDFQDSVPMLPLDQELLRAEIQGMGSVDRLPPSVMVQLWDYSTGAFKRARNGHGDLVPLQLSKWDALASDYGFDDVDGLMDGVTRTLNLNRQIRDKKYQMRVAMSD